MELNGKCVAILPPNSFVSQKNNQTYVRNTFIIEHTDDKGFTTKVAMSVMGEDKFAKMGIVVGASYNVSFDVSSREYQGRWYTECQAWRVVRLDGASTRETMAKLPNAPQSPVQAPMYTQANASTNDVPSDLPF